MPLWGDAKLVRDNQRSEGGDFGPVPFDFENWSNELAHVYDDTVQSLKRDAEMAWPALLTAGGHGDLWNVHRSILARRPMFITPISYFRDCANDPAPTPELRRVAEEAWVGASSIWCELGTFYSWVGRVIARNSRGLRARRSAVVDELATTEGRPRAAD